MKPYDYFQKETSKNMTHKILCEVALTLIFIACSVASFVIW